MTLDEIFLTLERTGIRLWLEGDRLRYRAPRDVMTEQVRSAIRAHRSAIIARLRLGQRKSTPEPAQCSACDCRDWIDAPSQEGWIRTTCGRCGAFIGYRPASFGTAGRRT